MEGFPGNNLRHKIVLIAQRQYFYNFLSGEREREREREGRERGKERKGKGREGKGRKGRGKGRNELGIFERIRKYK